MESQKAGDGKLAVLTVSRDPTMQGMCKKQMQAKDLEAVQGD